MRINEPKVLNAHLWQIFREKSNQGRRNFYFPVCSLSTDLFLKGRDSEQIQEAMCENSSDTSNIMEISLVVQVVDAIRSTSMFCFTS